MVVKTSLVRILLYANAISIVGTMCNQPCFHSVPGMIIIEKRKKELAHEHGL